MPDVEDNTSDASKDRKDKGPLEFNRWLGDNVEALLIAIVLALVIKFFVVEAFKIPTGSMAPGLLGVHENVTCTRCGYEFELGASIGRTPGMQVYCPICDYYFDAEVERRWGHRILVNKFIYNFRPPRPWEVIVFKSPESPEKNFIKRMVANSNDDIDIRRGDLFINGKIARKTAYAQRALWFDVYDSNLDHSSWNPWEFDGFRMENNAFLSDPAGTISSMRYGRTIFDTYGYQNEEGSSVVEDILVILDLKIRSQNGRYTIRLGSDADCFRVDFEFKNGRAVAKLTNDNTGASAGLKDVPVDFHEGFNNVSFANADERLTLKVNGTVVYDFDYEPSESWGSDYSSNKVEFACRELSVTLANVEIKRDIFYTRRNLDLDEIHRQQEEFRENGNGDVGYFCLGDNSPSSNDSRAWGFVREKDVLGMGLFVFYAGDKWVFDDWKFIK